MPNFRRRAARKPKTIRRWNFICAGWSRSSCNWRNGQRNKPEHVLRKTEYPSAIRDLIAQLRQMPGVGPRSAERIALWIVQARGDQPETIARSISTTRATVRPCPRCGFFTMEPLCEICSDQTRTADLLCVVEQ